MIGTALRVLGALAAIWALAVVALSLPAHFHPADVLRLGVNFVDVIAETTPVHAAGLLLGLLCWGTVAAVAVLPPGVLAQRRKPPTSAESREQPPT